MADTTTAPAKSAPTAGVPDNGQLILWSLIIVAAVANLNLSVANVALPSIGLAFDATQTQLNLVAVGYSLGLAASVLWLGALGDRYGRKMMLLLGIGLSIPACSPRRPSRHRSRSSSSPEWWAACRRAWRTPRPSP